MSKTYEIHDLTTEEILVDNLTFEELPELLEAYQLFYSNHDIVGCYRMCQNAVTIIKQPNTIRSSKQVFLNDWFALVEENIVNFY